MKVKVSYTVNVDDIPALVQEILASIKHDISDCTARLVFNPSNFDKMVEDYQAAREKLDVIDNQIQDIIGITAGWLETFQPEPENVLATEEEKEVVHEEKV